VRSIKLKLAIAVVLVLLLGTVGQVAADGKSLYLLNMGSGLGEGLYSYDIQGNGLVYQIRSDIANAYNAVGLALDEDSQYLFITYESASYINVYNANTMAYETQATASGASNLAGIFVEQATHKVYAVDRGQGKLYVYAWDGAAKTLTISSPAPLTT